MTAFARESAQTQFGELTFECRSINHRFLDISFRLPETFRYLEPKMRVLISQYLQRGKIDISLNFLPLAASEEIKVNHVNLQQLMVAITEVQHITKSLAQIDPLALLKWPGIVNVSAFDHKEIEGMVLKCFETTLSTLKINRGKEGAALAKIILEKVAAAEIQVEQVQKFSHTIATTLKAKLEEKLKSFTIDMDTNRLEQEIILQCQKADIQEELDRLKTHLTEVYDIIKLGNTVGRKLDFLMQELNREANTLGSKSINIESTNAAIELKVLIEQMREQIQNIE